MRISDWSSDVCSSDLERAAASPVPIHTALPPQAPSRQTAPSPTMGRGIRRERGRAPSAHEEVLGAVGFDRLGEAAEGVDVGCGAHGDVLLARDGPDRAPFALHDLLQALVNFSHGPVVTLPVLDPFDIGDVHAAGVGGNVGKNATPLLSE